MIVMRRIFGFGVLLIFAVNLSYCQSKQTITPRTYVAHKTTEKINVDGQPKESAWQQAKPSTLFIDIEGVKKPKYKTTVKMLWDDTNLYFLAEMEEPHVWATLKQRDTIIFYNNDFEIFIDPDNDTHNYYEFEMNALNTLWDLFIQKPYREGAPVLNNWDARGFQSAVKVNGTLNNSSDTDKGWVIEVAIPLAVFKTSYYQKINLANNFWRINFSRVNWDHDLKDGKYSRKKDASGKFLHEYNWVWSPIGVINMHEPENWGYVYFSEKSPTEEDSFTIPEDEKVRNYLYLLYKKQEAFYKKNNQFTTSIDELMEAKKQIYKASIETHKTGYNITAVSPYTNKEFTIKENGKIITKQ